MAEFIDLQADINTTNSEFEEEVNYEKDKVSSLIDDFLVDDMINVFTISYKMKSKLLMKQ